MYLSGLLEPLRGHAAYRGLLAELSDLQPGRPQTLGLIHAARAYVLAALALDTGRPLLVIGSRIDHAQNLAEQLLAWAPDLRVLTYAEPDALFYERTPWSMRAIRARLEVLATLDRGVEPGTVIVTSARALMQRTLPPDYIRAHSLTLRRGGRITGGQPEALLRRWFQVGYRPAPVVTEPGTFSHRGGILDVFPIAASLPVRIELWGDEIESLREFDPATQRSLTEIAEIIITPAREALPQFGLLPAARLKGWFAAQPTPPDEDESGHKPNGQRTPHPDQTRLLQQEPFDLLEFYLPWMYDDAASLLDYLPDDTLIAVDELAELADTIADLEEQALGLYRAGRDAGDLPPEMPHPFITWSQLQDGLSQAALLELGGGQMGLLADRFTPGQRFAGQLRLLLDTLADQMRASRERVVVVSRQAARLAELWHELRRGPRPQVVEHVTALPTAGLPLFVQGALAEGWQLDGAGGLLHLYTDAEIFGWQRPEPRRRVQRRAITPEDFFADLAPGDVVVHAEFGIGRFQGLEKRTLGGAEREFLVLTYAGGDVLYVPIYQADRLSRYVGVNDEPPELSRLGTQEWARVKRRTREAVEEVARELLELYAMREAVRGHAFSPDTPWQAELEASFPYMETEDQLRALAEVKADMERPRPMDRLICGDVGYGKTEVALRAAFKAVMDGKQVAVLVPTTVLAQQHLETFQRRLAPFPVTVEMLSRFRSPAEQEHTIAGLAAGTVDIVIGTHRLLSSDVSFKDLGLLIIDEEQRFGVAHKEQLKRMRTEVDVLTLTATPIPRTLYMGLTGVRDISMINTAPEERLPIVTHVGRRDDDLIRQAVLREIDRGGQVFFVHNRIQSIYTEQARLQRLIPEAAIGVAHGQMNEAELERVMQDFAEGHINLLLSTNIIEAGLDIPNANTLIVDRADRFGLAQLYQLRGRVGRSATRAFAYFFHPPYHRLTPEARARLETIAEYSDLGAGMNIAMRDLEIRGSGDILGIRQSGHIAAVGFHLYMRMLAQAVKQLRELREGTATPVRGEPEAPREVVTIDIPLPTYIPTDYIPDMALRIQIYRRMGDLADEAAIAALGEELADRFGPLPAPLENLLYQLRVKLLALRASVDAVVGEGGQMSIRLPGLAYVDRAGLQRRLGHNCRVSRAAIWLPREGAWQQALLEVLEMLAEERIALAAPPAS
ncbi:MAG: transcription-repair coupling factor [Anaerolineae bacterium]